uniref:Neprosin PEP catalytic domain-containing protein n=1 Tax=Kalanchoe fedtschenkoi TaxID=63787 RepID=A0A7N0TQ31_KALFE
MSLRLYILVFCGCFLNFTNGLDVKITLKEKIELNSLFKLYNKPAVEEIKINPSMYGGDGTTRLFLSTEVEKTKCWNLMCGGYVHTHKDIPIDAAITRVTYRGQPSPIEIVPKIVKDPTTKQWNLFITHDTLLGFWPNEVLKGLAGAAEYLEWGGEAYNPPDKGLSGPGMGSAFFPTNHGDLDGYARIMARYDEAGNYVDIGQDETEMYSDNNDYYRVIDGGYIDKVLGHMAFWGGPGKQG